MAKKIPFHNMWPACRRPRTSSADIVDLFHGGFQNRRDEVVPSHGQSVAVSMLKGPWTYLEVRECLENKSRNTTFGGCRRHFCVPYRGTASEWVRVGPLERVEASDSYGSPIVNSPQGIDISEALLLWVCKVEKSGKASGITEEVRWIFSDRTLVKQVRRGATSLLYCWKIGLTISCRVTPCERFAQSKRHPYEAKISANWNVTPVV
jgi:hypothetical protein